MSPLQEILNWLTSPKPWGRVYSWGMVLSVVSLSGGCVTTPTENSSSAKIVTTFLPMYLFTKGVTGSDIEVELLVPPNIEPHEYQASPSDAQKLAQAQILIKNGLGMEEFLEGLIASAGNTQLQQVDASQGIDVLQAGEHSDHSHAEGNPHVWLDPILAQKQVKNIRDGLMAADPSHAQIYQANAAVYLEKLQQLDQDFQTRLSPLKGCQFIAFHDAYPYLAQRYSLQQMAVVELPEDEISPRDIQRVIQAVEQYPVKALVSEAGAEDSRLQQISNEVGLSVKKLDPIETGSLDPEYYLNAMQKNLQTLEEMCK